MKNLQSSPDEQSEDHLLAKGVLIRGFRPGSTAQAAGMKKGDVIVKYGGIGNLTTESLAAFTATTNREKTSTRVAFLRDCQEHSVELPPGPLGISAMDTSMQGSSQLRMAQFKIESVVQTIQRIYLTFAVLASLSLLSHLLESAGVVEVLKPVLVGTLYGLVYFGLRNRKEWVIALVLILSALNCVPCFLVIMRPAEDIKTLLARILGFLLLLFFAYNIMFFRRAHVRTLFGDKGTLVF